METRDWIPNIGDKGLEDQGFETRGLGTKYLRLGIGDKMLKRLLET